MLDGEGNLFQELGGPRHGMSFSPRKALEQGTCLPFAFCSGLLSLRPSVYLLGSLLYRLPFSASLLLKANK